MGVNDYPLCKLCLKLPANQTGSHIFSYFLIKTAINDEDKTERDHELSFNISSTNFVRTYFGRSITPEKIVEVKGRELTDEEIQDNKSPFIIDHLLCSSCERKLQVVEDYFSKNVYSPLEKRSEDNFVRVLTLTNLDSNTIRLFLISLVWRGSASNYQGFNLKQKEENNLRVLLNKCLDSSLDQTIVKGDENSSKLKSLPITVIYHGGGEGSDSNNVIYSHKSQFPYFLILNNISIQLYIKESHLRSTPQDLFGIRKIFQNQQVLNYEETLFRIGLLKADERQMVNKKIMVLFSEERLKNLIVWFYEIHKKIFGVKPTEIQRKRFLNELCEDNVETIERYSRSHLEDVIKKTYMALGLIKK